MTSVAATASNVYVGLHANPGVGGGSGYLMRVDAATGAVLGEVNFLGVDTGASYVAGVAANDNYVYVGGTIDANDTGAGGFADALVSIRNPDLSEVVTDEFGALRVPDPDIPMFGVGNDHVTGVALDGDSVIVVGTTEGSLGDPLTGLPGSGGFLRRYDLGGGSSLASSSTYEVPELSAIAASGGNIAVAGTDLVARVSEPSGSGRFLYDDGNVQEANIEAIADAGITLGCTLDGEYYCPSDSVSRAQMASFLVRAFSLPATATDYFADDGGNTHEANINALREAGVTLGCGTSGTTYCPDDLVNRAQMASFIARAIGLTPIAGTQFTDVSRVHAGNIYAIAAEGVTLGCDPAGTLYCPDQTVLRDQMASFLARALNLVPRPWLGGWSAVSGRCRPPHPPCVGPAAPRSSGSRRAARSMIGRGLPRRRRGAAGNAATTGTAARASRPR